MSYDWQTVNLVGITKPIGEQFEGNESAENLISYCARVSNKKNQGNFDTAPKLLKYLIDNNHWSPLETVSLVFEIQTTRDIARQILRHRSFTFQELSQRYSEQPDMFPDEMMREARMQDKKNRQSSFPTDNQMLIAQWTLAQQEIQKKALSVYKWALDSGIAKECARAILPEGLTMTTMYCQGTLRSWYHYCMLRMENGTQLEHQDIAKKCWEIIKQEFPIIDQIQSNG